MLSVLWEIVLPLFVAFVVGWLVMGWLTWGWRRSGAGRGRPAEATDDLVSTRAELEKAKARVAELEANTVRASVAGTGSKGTGPAPRPGPNGTVDAADPKPTVPPLLDDLKAIRGVGVKMEAKLHELGVTSLHQVAAFTEEEIQRVSAGIGAFPGRIERDRWVPQAEVLVARLGEQATDG